MATASEMTGQPAVPEVRLERLRFEGVTAALERAPIAWIPLGLLEYHADHLPNGTDASYAEIVEFE